MPTEDFKKTQGKTSKKNGPRSGQLGRVVGRTEKKKGTLAP